MDTSSNTTPKQTTFLTNFLLKLFDIRNAADTNRYIGNKYSPNPKSPKKNPDTTSPTIPQILKFAIRRKSENANITMSIISFLICLCLACSAAICFFVILGAPDFLLLVLAWADPFPDALLPLLFLADEVPDFPFCGVFPLELLFLITSVFLFDEVFVPDFLLPEAIFLPLLP